jgi:hypothetical protein
MTMRRAFAMAWRAVSVRARGIPDAEPDWVEVLLQPSEMRDRASEHAGHHSRYPVLRTDLDLTVLPANLTAIALNTGEQGRKKWIVSR